MGTSLLGNLSDLQAQQMGLQGLFESLCSAAGALDGGNMLLEQTFTVGKPNKAGSALDVDDTNATDPTAEQIVCAYLPRREDRQRLLHALDRHEPHRRSHHGQRHRRGVRAAWPDRRDLAVHADDGHHDRGHVRRDWQLDPVDPGEPGDQRVRPDQHVRAGRRVHHLQHHEGRRGRHCAGWQAFRARAVRLTLDVRAKRA